MNKQRLQKLAGILTESNLGADPGVLGDAMHKVARKSGEMKWGSYMAGATQPTGMNLEQAAYVLSIAIDGIPKFIHQQLVRLEKKYQEEAHQDHLKGLK